MVSEFTPGNFTSNAIKEVNNVNRFIYTVFLSAFNDKCWRVTTNSEKISRTNRRRLNFDEM